MISGKCSNLSASSPAKAGDPVDTVNSDQAQVRARTAIMYWMPAFAGTTPQVMMDQPSF